MSKIYNMYPKGPTMEPWVLQWSPKVPTNAKKNIKNSPKFNKDIRRCPKVEKTNEKYHIDTDNQAKNQPTKETQRNTKKLTIEQTHTQERRTANTNPNSRGRVLAEGDVDPAAGSPKEPFRLQVEAPERSEHS